MNAIPIFNISISINISVVGLLGLFVAKFRLRAGHDLQRDRATALPAGFPRGPRVKKRAGIFPNRPGWRPRFLVWYVMRIEFSDIEKGPKQIKSKWCNSMNRIHMIALQQNSARGPRIESRESINYFFDQQRALEEYCTANVYSLIRVIELEFELTKLRVFSERMGAWWWVLNFRFDQP